MPKKKKDEIQTDPTDFCPTCGKPIDRWIDLGDGRESGYSPCTPNKSVITRIKIVPVARSHSDLDIQLKMEATHDNPN